MPLVSTVIAAVLFWIWAETSCTLPDAYCSVPPLKTTGPVLNPPAEKLSVPAWIVVPPYKCWRP